MKRLWFVPLLLLMFGCGASKEDLPGRIVVIALDAADPVVIETMRERGELPNYDRLVHEGVSMEMKVDEPIFSPRIWTSIFTGFRPEKHGIESFTVTGEGGRKVPVTSNLVRRREVWDILGDAGVKVGVAGQWVTWPAKPVNGFLLSFYTWPPSGNFEKEWAPAADWDTVGYRTYPEDILDEAKDAVEEKRFVKWMDIPESPRLPNELKWYLRKDLDFVNASLALYDKEQPRFFTFYIESTDFVPHKLWLFHRYNEYQRFGGDLEGLQPPESPLPPQFLDFMGSMVGNVYKFTDKVIGLVLERVDLSKDVVIVVSDHGFKTYGDEPELHVGDDRYEKMPFWHSDTGVFFAAGPPFAKGLHGAELSPEDVTPILLAIAGLPVGGDMDGRVPEKILTKSFLEKHPTETVPTYETGEKAGDDRAVEAPFSEAALEQLRSLGYVQ